ncbi:beta-Ig-H3/fasciclin [Scytonema sp. UIC 10036]|nr:beta-Ig-H3/fasciclin [Scytonema sp. UIC 10036]
MYKKMHLTARSAALIALGVATVAVAPNLISAPVSAQIGAPTVAQNTNFPDVGSNYWAQPFIQALAARDIIVGFPDGTYRPDQPVTRAEFAAMIQKAFNQNQVRQLPQGGFRDVRSAYWAASAIQEAYETGFMSGYPGNLFVPNERIPKVQAIISLASGLGLTASSTSTEQVLTTYYTDASTIPSYALSGVASATQANLVVNYPNVNVLNPLTALTRAEAAAHIYQALVRLGQLQPIPGNVAAASYIVGRTAGDSTPNNQDIVSLAGASGSFTVLTSLLKTAGLADTLQQQGPYTVFAPTDEAFAAVPQTTLQQLQQPENRETLLRILRYHVVPGAIATNELKSGNIETAEGQTLNLKVNTNTNQITVNNASVLQSGVQASNGVIYPINQVLIPSNVSLGQKPRNGGDDITPGRATRGVSSYIGVGGNIGLGGDSALAEGNFAVVSKIGLTRFISVRPSAVIGDDTVVLVPISFDFAQRSTDAFNNTFGIAPYIGAGVAIETSDDADVGFLLSGGVDVPLGRRFTLTGAVNAAFLDDTDVGIVLGIGYNFRF